MSDDVKRVLAAWTEDAIAFGLDELSEAAMQQLLQETHWKAPRPAEKIL